MASKKLLLAFSLALTTLSSWAVKASPIPFVVTQSDGTTLTVHLNGDETFCWYSTADGAILSRQGGNFYIAHIDEAGNVSPTELLAHNATSRSFEEINVVAKQNRAMFFLNKAKEIRNAKQVTSIQPAANPSYFPHEGSPTAIVILVEFSDTKFTITDPVASFEQYLNGDEQNDYGHGENLNYGSVKKYFNDMSFGTFTPNFKLCGPYTLPDSMEYYGKNTNTTTDVNCIEMIKEACSLASDDIDFYDDEYDSDGDGIIDLVYVIYAGYSESNGASESTIWPKSGVASIGTYGGKKVMRYGVNNELNANPYVSSGTFSTPKINGVGLFCHEFSHCLGLPDIYPTVTSAQIDNQAMEYWDLMDGGEYSGYGYYPTAYTAWEREVLGWHTITELTANDHTITISPVNDGGTSYKMVNPNDEDEYFVLEDIQKDGWNSYSLGHGLIVYHVKWPTEGVSYSQHANNTASKPALALVPADGLLISSENDEYSTSEYKNSHSGDPFPGTSNVTTLTYKQSLPNYIWYTKGPSVYKSLKNISEDTANMTVTFDYDAGTANGIDDAVTFVEAQQKTGIYSLDGTYIGTALPRSAKGVFIINGKKIVKE